MTDNKPLTLPLDGLRLLDTEQLGPCDVVLRFNRPVSPGQAQVLHNLVFAATQPHGTVREMAMALFDLVQPRPAPLEIQMRVVGPGGDELKIQAGETGAGVTEAFLQAHYPKQDDKP